MLDAVRVETPDEQINRLVNIWSKQQIQLCVEFGRDGARGFRDTLQDAWGIAPFNAPLAKAKIKETLKRINTRTVMACGGGYRFSRITTQTAPLGSHRQSRLTSRKRATALSLMKRCHISTRSKLPCWSTHLPAFGISARTSARTTVLLLAHEGDWNDSLNWMGRAGKGESVWTSMALFHSCNVMAEMARDLLHDKALEAEMRERAAKIEAAIQQHGWDGKWYLAGWSDFGNRVGSSKNKEGQIYLNTQTWAVLTGLAQGVCAEWSCLKAVDEMLEVKHGSMTLWPHYTASDENVGRVTMLLPGMYENGTPYCHGTAFKIVTDIMAGRPDEALRSWRKVMPDNAAHPSIVSGCEPYAFTNQYLGPGNGRAGDSISGWITGTAGWMFRAVIEYFCGVKPGYDGFMIEPCLPSEWNHVKIHRVLRGKAYRRSPLSGEGKGYQGSEDQRGPRTTEKSRTNNPIALSDEHLMGADKIEPIL